MSASFGHLIKNWRSIRRFSQLALSMETGISSRHISFLETGRSKPSRGSVMTLARALEIPKPVVNEALLAAGFAPEYPAHDLSDINLKPMMDAMATILSNHAPLPAIVIDGDWQIVGGNSPAMKLMHFFPFKGSMCIVDALLNDDPNDPVFLNWDIIAAWTLTRLQLEVARLGYESPLSDIYKRLSQDPRCINESSTNFSAHKPYLTMQTRIDGHDLSLFTMLAEFTSAQDIALSERRVELFFAANEPTRLYFESLASTG